MSYSDYLGKGSDMDQEDSNLFGLNQNVSMNYLYNEKYLFKIIFLKRKKLVYKKVRLQMPCPN